jgi:hypothetical protein
MVLDFLTHVWLLLMQIVGADGKPAATDFDTLAFKLAVKCQKNLDADQDELDPHKIFRHANGAPYFRVSAHS